MSIHRIPSSFLISEGFPVIRDHWALCKAWDDILDDSCGNFHIEGADDVNIDEQFSASEILYRLCRRTYDMAFAQWSERFINLNDGGYLNKAYEQRAADCWSIEMEKKDSKWKEKSEE